VTVRVARSDWRAEVCATLDALESELDDLVVRGLSSCNNDDVRALIVCAADLNGAGASHVAGRIDDVVNRQRAADKGAARALLQLMTSLRVFERVLTLEAVADLFAGDDVDAPSATATYGTNRDGRENSTYGKGLYSATPNRPPIGDTGSAARFFKQCKGYTEAWPNLLPEPANTAGNISSPSRQFVAFVLSDAATWALPVGSCNSLSLAPSTSATGSELRQLSESVITAIQSIAPKFWQESKPAKLTLTLSHASFAVTREQTGITTITASHWKSDGSAEPVTFNITGTNTEAGDRVSAPRAFYTAKAAKSDRDDGNTHPTVKPTDLMRYLCRLVTPPGGIVLDPFMGSGSTGKAAMLEGFEFIGIEREPSYHAIAEQRIGRAAAAGYQPSLIA
jgi:hypothetical protein